MRINKSSRLDSVKENEDEVKPMTTGELWDSLPHLMQRDSEFLWIYCFYHRISVVSLST